MASSFHPPWATQDTGELIAHAGHIPKAAVKGASIALFVIAMLTATARTAIRLTQQRRLFADDGLLMVAVVFLIASMVLLWHQLDEMFVAEALVTNTATTVVITGNWVDQLFWFLKISDAFLVLSWTSEMAVKFSFLLFFRNLISRVRGMKLYWWIVFAISTAVWIFGCGAVFAPCPYFDIRSLSCSQGSQYGIAVAYSAAIIALDILIDLLILVIPIYLISQIQIKLRQKIALGFSLCLSIVIVMISITCIAGIRAPTTSNAIDVVWELFWQAAEACVSVTMVSLVAFRSFFVAHASRHQRSPPQQASPPQPKTPSTEQRRRQMLWRKKFQDVSEETTWNDSTTEGTENSPRWTETHAPAPASTASRFRLPGFRGLPDIPSARLSGVLTRFTAGSRRIRHSSTDIMRSNASWAGSADRDLERGSSETETAVSAERDRHPHPRDSGERPGMAVTSASRGPAPSQVSTLRVEPEIAELGAARKSREAQRSLDESRAESELDLPIQVPLPDVRWAG